MTMGSWRAGGERIQKAKSGYHNNHAAEMLVSVSRRKKKTSKIYSDEFSSLKPPSPSLPLPPFAPPSQPHLQLSDSGFLAFSWSNPSEQYWTSHSIQTSFYPIFLFPSVYFLFCPLFFPPFGYACIPCTLSLLKNYKGFGSCWDIPFKIITDFISNQWQKPKPVTFKQRADFQCTAMQHSFPAPWLFSLLQFCACVFFCFIWHVQDSSVFPYLDSELLEPHKFTSSRKDKNIIISTACQSANLMRLLIGWPGNMETCSVLCWSSGSNCVYSEILSPCLAPAEPFWVACQQLI